MKNNEIMIFNNDELNLNVRTIKNENGSISVNAEDTAIGYGWTQKEIKNGKTYATIKWSRMNGFIKDLGFDHKCTKDDYIPESLFYMLGMKASNDAARKFQWWLASDVIPSIRKDGGYISPDATPEQICKLNNKWAKQSKYLTEEIHDRKSIRKFIRDYDPMKLDECIDTIADMCNKMKGSIKHDLLDVAIRELKNIDARLIRDTNKHTYVKDTALDGIVLLQDVKIDKYKRKLA